MISLLAELQTALIANHAVLQLYLDTAIQIFPVTAFLNIFPPFPNLSSHWLLATFYFALIGCCDLWWFKLTSAHFMSHTSFLSNFKCSPTTFSFFCGSVFLTSQGKKRGKKFSFTQKELKCAQKNHPRLLLVRFPPLNNNTKE